MKRSAKLMIWAVTFAVLGVILGITSVALNEIVVGLVSTLATAGLALVFFVWSQLQEQEERARG